MIDVDQLKPFIKLCGNKYAATRYVAKEARKLAEEYDNVISHAEALTWVLTGEIPKDILSYYQDMVKLKRHRSLSAAYELIEYVLDEDIKESVVESYIRSLRAGHLIYYYHGVYDEYKQARVRILTRMVWDELHEQNTML